MTEQDKRQEELNKQLDEQLAETVALVRKLRKHAEDNWFFLTRKEASRYREAVCKLEEVTDKANRLMTCQPCKGCPADSPVLILYDYKGMPRKLSRQECLEGRCYDDDGAILFVPNEAKIIRTRV